MALELHEDTRRAIEELFEGKRCAKCGEQAQRFYDKMFLCESHALTRKQKENRAYRIPKCKNHSPLLTRRRK